MSNVLKQTVYKQIQEMADDKEAIVYENYHNRKAVQIETYIVIVRISSYGFRIYQGMLHSTGRISVKYMSVDSDMFEAMKNVLGLKVD